MPTYEYHCDTCEKNFDVVQSFQDDAITECPTCGSPVRKVFGNVGIVFKGSGFYKTDSRSGGSTKSSDSGESSASSGSKSEASTSNGDTTSISKTNDSVKPASAETSRQPDKKSESTTGSASTSKQAPAAKQ